MSQGEVVNVTPVLSTDIYADGDVLFVPIEVPQVFKGLGQTRALHSVIALDEDDQNVGFDLVFFNASAALGTLNAAVSISDADARNIIGYVDVTTADSHDLINSRLFVKDSVGQMLESAGVTASLWVGGIVRGGTPTYTASGIKLKLGFV